jgi:hypothetical protein
MDDAKVSPQAVASVVSLLGTLSDAEAQARTCRPRLSDAVLQDIARLWAVGASASDIAELIGAPYSAVRLRLRRAGVYEKRWPSHYPRVRAVLKAYGDELIASYEAGTPLAPLAADAGISILTFGDI